MRCTIPRTPKGPFSPACEYALGSVAGHHHSNSPAAGTHTRSHTCSNAKGASIDTRGAYGRNAIHSAAITEKVEAVSFLMSAGIHVFFSSFDSILVRSLRRSQQPLSAFPPDGLVLQRNNGSGCICVPGWPCCGAFIVLGQGCDDCSAQTS